MNINILSSNNTNKIIVIIAVFSLSVVITGTFFPFEQGKAASAQRQINNNNNNNNPYLPLSMLSTVTGTGAMATGVIVTVPGVLRTRKQSKCMSTYLLKIHHKYNQLTKSPDKKEYLEFFEGLRSDIIYLLHRRDINEHQYKMLDDRIIEYLNKINHQSKITNLK